MEFKENGSKKLLRFKFSAFEMKLYNCVYTKKIRHSLRDRQLIKRQIYRPTETVDIADYKFSSVFNGSCQTINQI